MKNEKDINKFKYKINDANVYSYLSFQTTKNNLIKYLYIIVIIALIVLFFITFMHYSFMIKFKNKAIKLFKTMGTTSIYIQMTFIVQCFLLTTFSYIISLLLTFIFLSVLKLILVNNINLVFPFYQLSFIKIIIIYLIILILSFISSYLSTYRIKKYNL